MPAPLASPGLQLQKREARSLPMSGWSALALGGCLTLFVAAMGAGIVAVLVTRAVPTQVWIYLALPIAALPLTLGLVGYGVLTLLRRARAEKRAALHPDEPWSADWAWDPAGAVEERSAGSSFVFLFFGLVMAGAFTALFFMAALPSPELPAVAKAFFGLIVGIWDLVLLKAIFHGLKALFARFGERPARLQFSAFPFFLGRPLEAQVTAPALTGRDGVVVTLRCLEERIVHRHRNRLGGHNRAGTRSIGVFQMYEVGQRIEERVGSDASISVTLPTPDADLPTALRWPPPRYWELEVTAPDIDPIRFLVPVYRSAGIPT